LSLGYDFHLNNMDNGNVLQTVNYRDFNRTQNFTYDSLNRISTAYTNGSNWGETFTIDAWGNLTNRGPYAGKTNYESLNAAPATSQNRLPGFGYDAAGNIIQNGSASYTYDAENRLVNSGGVMYTYDGDGNRVQKSTGTTYWGAGPLAESDLSGNITADYIFFNGKRVARRDATSAVSYYFSDHLGSASVVTNSVGVVTDESDYYPYGGEIPVVNNDPNHYKFTRKERDTETGLDYFGARYYGSNMGRWLSADWSGAPEPVPYADLSDPQTLNLYGYVRNNPLGHADADGHCDENGICGTLVGAAQGTWNFVKNTAVGTVQVAGAVAQDMGSPVPMNTGTMLATPVVNAAQDYSTMGVSGVANAVLDQGGQGAMAIVTEAVLTGGLAASSRVGGAPTETVQRAMSTGELEATQSTGLLRGGREGTHYVSDAISKDAGRAQQRLALPQRSDVRTTMEVPKGKFGSPTRVKPANNMPGVGWSEPQQERFQ
jgi:RHS repeat-associated protein